MIDGGSPQWLAAGMCLERLEALAPELLGAGMPWLSATLGEVGGLPPPGVVIDVGLLLSGAPLDTSRAEEVAAPRLREAIGRYEDRVLGRLAGERHLQAARDAFAGLPEPLLPLAVAVVVAGVVGGAAVTAVAPGMLRKLGLRAPVQLLALGFDAWREQPDVLDALARGYDALCERAHTAGSLLSEAQVFALENLAVLGELGQRVAVAQIVSAAEALGTAWPKRIKMKRRDVGTSPVALEDESAYPAGGFSSVANVGTLENLVTSELVFMSPRGARGAGEVDLFDVRYAEGELLYYTRDEALIVRPRRVVAFVLHPSLVAARLKDQDVPWQRIVVVLGLVVAAVRRLERWLGESDLFFSCIFETDGARPALERERQLLELLLTEWRDKGMAEVVAAPRAGWLERLGAVSARAEVRTLLIARDVALGDEDPRLAITVLDARARSWDGWCRDGLEALRQLV
jgi:hypothetical protein